MSDPHLWRPLHAAVHGGVEPVGRFAEFGKGWFWIYHVHFPIRISRKRMMEMPHSVGTLRHGDSVYCGDFHRAYKHGYGRASWMNGATYDGEWKDDRKHGRGVYTWPDGVRYGGAWEYDKMHGRGTMRYTDGHVYAGTWQRGVFGGVGIHISPDGHRARCRRKGIVWCDIDSGTDNKACADHPDSKVVATTTHQIPFI